MERGLHLAFEVDYSHRDKLSLKLSREYSHYTRCNELCSDCTKTNTERHQIKGTLEANLCTPYLPGYS